MPVENIDNDKCIGCGTCVATCPMDVFRMDKKTKKSTITYQTDCQICHLCRIYCPVDAITGTRKEIHVIDPVKCVKCGICKAVCNFEAVRIES